MIDLPFIFNKGFPGSLDALINGLIEQVRNWPMEVKEKAGILMQSLCEQPMGLDGLQMEPNSVLLAKAGAIKPLVSLVNNGSPVAQGYACSALATVLLDAP